MWLCRTVFRVEGGGLNAAAAGVQHTQDGVDIPDGPVDPRQHLGVVHVPLSAATAAMGSPVVGAMLRPAVHAAVQVVMTEIPGVAGLDQLTAAPAHHAPGCDDRRPLLAQAFMVGAVAALGGGAAGTPVLTTTIFAPPRLMSCERSGGASRLVHANTRSLHVDFFRGAVS